MKEGGKMHLYCHENENLNKIIDSGVRDSCLCERVNEEYMRSLIKRARELEVS